MAVIDLRPLTVDLTVYAGDDIDLDVAVTDNAGAPFDLTGYTAKAQIRASADAPSALDFDTTVVANTVTLHMDGAVSETLPLKGVWDVEITSATGAVTTLAGGKVTVTAGVSR